MLSVLASGEPNHSFPLGLGALFALVHLFKDNPSPSPLLPFPSSLDTLVPLSFLESLDEVRKRLIAPKVNMSSVDMLNPDEAGAIGEERLKKGLNRLLGFVVQLEVGEGDFLDVVVVVGG